MFVHNYPLDTIQYQVSIGYTIWKVTATEVLHDYPSCGLVVGSLTQFLYPQ